MPSGNENLYEFCMSENIYQNYQSQKLMITFELVQFEDVHAYKSIFGNLMTRNELCVSSG